MRVAAWNDHSPFAKQRADHELGLVLCDCMENLSDRTATNEPFIICRIKNAEQHLIQNLPRGYGVTEMAQVAGYSRGRFTEVYRQYYFARLTPMGSSINQKPPTGAFLDYNRMIVK